MLHQFNGRVQASPPLVNSGDAPNRQAGSYSGFPDDGILRPQRMAG